VKSNRLIIRALFVFSLLPTLLFASKIVSHNIDVRNDRVDVVLHLDSPYRGSLRKTRNNEQIIVTLENTLTPSPKVVTVESPLLSKLSLAPAGDKTKLLAYAGDSVSMKAARSRDGLRLRLRFEKPASASRAAALASAAAAAPSAKSALSEPKAGFFGDYPLTYYLAVLSLILLLLLVLWRRSKHKRRRARTASLQRARFFIAARQKISTLMPRLAKRAKPEATVSKEIGDTAPSRLQRILNPRNKLVLTVTGLIVIMLLLPKINLYYQLEHEIKPYGIILSGEQLDDKGFWLNIKDATLYVKQIESAHAQNIDVMLFGLYNRIDLQNIALSSTLEQFVPTELDHVKVRYSVLDPLHVTVDAAGDFGTARAKASIIERTLSVSVQPSKLMKSRFRSTLNRLKRDETGGYRYESRF
jgi:hypothetical protein